jgi:hypothetical protein
MGTLALSYGATCYAYSEISTLLPRKRGPIFKYINGLGRKIYLKNVVFWDIETQFVLHRRHITSPLQSPAS